MGKKWQTTKEVLKDLPYRVKDTEVAQIRAHYLNDWMEICGVTRVEDIDYDNPHVHIQWLLCDPYWQRAIKKPKGKAEFFEQLTEEERVIYATQGYADLENAKITKEVVKACKQKIKEKREEKRKVQSP